MEQIERFRGALLGMAAGDALGAQVEFMDRGTFDPVTDMDGRTVHGNPAGSWTDDTSMALCLAESLIECEGMDLIDQCERYVRWWHDGYLSSVGHCFDIGNTTSSTLQRFLDTGDPRSGGTNEGRDSGNGSIMRLAPVPLFFANTSRAEGVENSAESSVTTHATREAMDGCRYLGAIVHAAVNGASKGELLSEGTAPENLAPKIAKISRDSFEVQSDADIESTPYVVHTLEAALWAFYNSDSFEEGALLAVNLGDDADTTGAVYGQVAGAFYGESGIPDNWLETIAMRDEITRYADGLYELANR